MSTTSRLINQAREHAQQFNAEHDKTSRLAQYHWAQANGIMAALEILARSPRKGYDSPATRAIEEVRS